MNELIATCKAARDSSKSKERRELLTKLSNLLTGSVELQRVLDSNTQSATIRVRALTRFALFFFC